MSSINLESCDELVQNHPNSQFLQYKRQFHQGYEQMKSGLRNKSPIDNEKVLNSYNQEKQGISSQTFQIYSHISYGSALQKEQHNNLNQNITKDFNSAFQQHKTLQGLQNLNDAIKFQSSLDHSQQDQTYSTSHLFKDCNKISKKDLSTNEQSCNQFQNGSNQPYNNQVDNQLSSQIIQQQMSRQLQILQMPISDNKKLISHTSNIQEIDLSNSQLTVFSQDICQMLQLTKIKLDSNAITKIPSEINKLVNLKQLSISDNKIYSLPSSFEGLQSLILLNISKNFLDPFPQEICKLKNLVILHIQNNYFISLPLEFALLENLQEFSIEWFKYTFPSMNQIQSDYFTIQTLKNECKRLYLLRKQQYIQNYCMQDQSLPNNLTQQKLQENSQQLSEVQLNQLQINSCIQSFQTSQRGTDVMIDVDEYSNCFESTGHISDNSKIKNLQNIQTQYATKEVNNKNQLYLNNTNDLSFQQFLTLFSKDPISYLSKSDVRGRNIFHLSALNQEVSIIKAANFCQLHPQSINQMDDDYQTPLSLALLEEKFLSAKILLFFGADPLLGGGKLGTCLHIAVTKMDIEIVNQILNRGGDANSRDFEGNTPLHLIFSIFRKDKRKAASIIELLIQNGADCNVKNFDNWSPLHLAVKRMQVEAIEWIASYEKYGEKFNWNIQGGNQQLSLLHLASKLGYTEIIQVIIEKVDPLLVSRCNQIARDLGQSNNLISKLLKKKEIDVFKKHFNMQQKQLSEEQNQSNFDDKRNKQFKHLKSTFLLENKSFPIEKYEQLIEEKLAASKQIQQRNIKLEQEQKQNIQSNLYDNRFAKVPSLKENFALLRDYYGDSQLDFYNERQKSQDNTQRSKTYSIQQQNLILVNELEIYCQQVINLVKINSTELFLESKKQKTDFSSNTDRLSHLKSITEGQNNSCELLEQEEIKNMWYGKNDRLKIKNSNVLASSKILHNQDDSFEIIENSDDNIPEEYSSSHSKMHQFSIQNYQSTNNQLWQLSETEKNLQNILKQSINALIDERINLTLKLQLLQLLSVHIQQQKQNSTDLEKLLQLTKINQAASHTSSFDSNTQRSRSVISSRDDEKSINQRVLFDYLPLYLQSVIRYNSEKNSNQLIVTKILDLISLIPNQNLLQFLENFYKQISNQMPNCSSSVNLMKSIFDVYSFLQNQQKLKKKVSPLANFAKKSQQNKISNKKQQINNQNEKAQVSSVPPIAYFPSQSTAQVRIPRMNFNQTNQENSTPQAIKHKACYPTIQIDFYQMTQNQFIKEDQKTQKIENIYNELNENKYQNNIYDLESIQQYSVKNQNQLESSQNQYENDFKKLQLNQQNFGQTSNEKNLEQQQQQFNIINKANGSVSMHSQPVSVNFSLQTHNSTQKLPPTENNQNTSLLTPRDNNKSFFKQQENNNIKSKYFYHIQPQNQEIQNNLISKHFQEAGILNPTTSKQKKSLTPKKVNSAARVSNIVGVIKDTPISIQITPKKLEHAYSCSQNLQTLSATSSQSQQNTHNINKQQISNKKDQNSFTSSTINRDSSNQKIIETNPCITPSQTFKTQSTSTERLSFSANSYNIQQKIQLNRIIQSKTQTSQNNHISIKKPEKLFEATLEKKKQNSQTMRLAQDHIKNHKNNELNEFLKIQTKNEHSQLFKDALSQTYSFQSNQAINPKQEITENIQSKDVSAICSHLDSQNYSQNYTDILYQNNLTSKTTLSQTSNNYQDNSPKQISAIDSPKNRISSFQKQNSVNTKSQLPNKFSRFVK
ncbi:ankyrin repeat protein (macronuclear) [Tetrahymena thermophila SB210]|uniref:Ankyrin repeat protein n=1 Tax=Tetrahymena thermophila (strain SB210) TaxID=312017 RepID=I7MLN7_TETTS|nr:ankyrin repeat protein [Tetrahymena thermophila SB210]EAS02772.2 ankyrin repeat protein [Tetrahymena thermophila SB210]|eukprot:XP_001023017.2 ankyrin repeat protein [Tetrahymena thermophila SB210]